MAEVSWHQNPLRDGKPSPTLTDFAAQAAESVRAYHRSWPGYSATPLRSLDALAARIGIGSLLVKDEASRWGLNAFKVLGGTYGVGRALAHAYGFSEAVDFPTLLSRAAENSPVVFSTATDGNHGVGVAWAARRLGQKAKVFMPVGSSGARVRAIEAAGGDVTVTADDYDATVISVAREAERRGWVLAQDTVTEGSPKMARWIMQGYMTLVDEVFRPDRGTSIEPPTHVVLQAGVGSFAAAVVAYLANLLGPRTPAIVLVEPASAGCFFRSAQVGDGRLYPAPTEVRTLMAGLACGVGNPLAWDILKHWVTTFVVCDDAVTARGMRVLGNPLPGDPPVVAGESGAVGVGLLSLLEAGRNHPLRGALGLDGGAHVLCVNTEGATDPATYRRIVWDGDTP